MRRSRSVPARARGGRADHRAPRPDHRRAQPLRRCRAPPLARAPALAGARRQLYLAVGRPAQPAAAAGQRPARQGRARAQRPSARERARRFLGEGRDRRGPPRPGRHDVRAGAGERHQGEPGHPARRRHRPQHVGALRAGRDHSRALRDRHRIAQRQARERHPLRADLQPGLRGSGRLAADHPRQEYRRRSGRRRSRADAASARRRHHRLGQVGRPQLHDPVLALPAHARAVQNDPDRSQDARIERL